MSRHTKRWARAGRIGSDRLLEDRGLDRMHVFLTDSYGMGFTAALLSRRRLAGVDDGDLEWFTYLQFVPDLDPEYVKIGKSMDLRERNGQFQEAHWKDLVLAGAIRGENWEDRLHLAFEKHHVRGEWFRLPDWHATTNTICDLTNDRFVFTSLWLGREDVEGVPYCKRCWAIRCPGHPGCLEQNRVPWLERAAGWEQA